MIPLCRLLFVAGARPNFVKLAPLLGQFARQPEVECFVVHTGQHYDWKLSGVFFDQLGITQPAFNLEVGSGTYGFQVGEIVKRIEPVLLEVSPTLLFVLGDVNSTVAATLVAAQNQIPVAHIEAGLRSFDRTMPEEINRVVTDSLATYHFATEPSATENLRREGADPSRVYLVGNVMVDTLLRSKPLADESLILSELGLERCGDVQPYGVVTLHRQSNVDNAAKLSELLGTLSQVSRALPLIFPVHPRTKAHVETLRTHATLFPEAQGLRMVEPLAYLDFVRLLSKAAVVLTDSGGIQEETTILGIPCLTLRTNTERPITVTEGTNTLVGTSRERIVEEVAAILAGRRKQGKTPYLWDGKASERIADILLREFSLSGLFGGGTAEGPERRTSKSW